MVKYEQMCEHLHQAAKPEIPLHNVDSIIVLLLLNIIVLLLW